MKLDYEEKISRLQLIRTEKIGPITFWNLLKLFGSAKECIKKMPELSLRGGAIRAKTPYPREFAEKELQELEKFGGRMIFKEDLEFPNLLKSIPDCPPLLSVIGEIPSNKSVFAIVGARSSSLNAQKFAAKLSKDLSDAGFVIVSGFARGIDSYAHEAAKSTIAVFAGGLDVIYPQENEKLYDEILKKGAIISEVQLHTKPQAALFPRRNRLIAGLSNGIIIVEAAIKSGTLITANFALDYNRDVYAVPGFPEDPRCKGCNELIKKGAMLLTSAADIIQNMNLLNQCNYFEYDDFAIAKPRNISDKERFEARDLIESLISFEPIAINEIIDKIQDVQLVLTILVEMELAGKISRISGNKVVMNVE